MQNKLLITVLTIILITILTLTLHVSLVNASPVIFNMDTLPENEGWIVVKNGNGTSYVSDGILTLENTVGQIGYLAPDSWSNTVNNTKGWIVEFRLKINLISSSTINPAGGVGIVVAIHDKHQDTQIGFHENSIDVNPGIIYYMNTTDTFHVYRIMEQGDILKIFVDEKLVIDSFYNSGSMGSALSAGIVFVNAFPWPDTTIKSYWDYFSYDTNPNLTLTQPTLTFPTLTVINGTSSYYVSNLSGVTLDNFPSNYSIPNGTYAGWCVDKSIRMTRNEAHNISLYSTINNTLPYGTETFNWNAVNYILNHKQGSMQEIQDAIWYFVPDFVSPPTNEPNAMAMINAASANSNYVPGKGDIMAVIAYAGHPSSTSASGRSGVQNTILEYKIP